MLNRNQGNERSQAFSEATIKLLEIVERCDPDVANFINKKYGGIPVSTDSEQQAYDFLISQSVIASGAAANPGSSVVTESLYHGLAQQSFIDEYFLEASAGKAIKERRAAIISKLRKTIEEYCILGRKDILIGNLGSGPGGDLIDVLSHPPPQTAA